MQVHTLTKVIRPCDMLEDGKHASIPAYKEVVVDDFRRLCHTKINDLGPK